MDVCDAVLSRRDLATRQKILKDSHCGAFAVICMVLLAAGAVERCSARCASGMRAAAARSDPVREPRLRGACRAAPPPAWARASMPPCKAARTGLQLVFRTRAACWRPCVVPPAALRDGRVCAARGDGGAIALPSGAASGSWTACPAIFPASRLTLGELAGAAVLCFDEVR